MSVIIQTNKTDVRKEDFFTGYLSVNAAVWGDGILYIKHTDSYGRTVDTYEFSTSADDHKVCFEIPLEKSVTMVNFIEVKFIRGEITCEAPKYEFIVTPAVNKLDDYNVIMYYPYPNEHQENLKDIGITAGQVQSGRAMPNAETLGKAQIWWQNNFRFYVDQIALNYYANYHSPVHDPKDKLLIEAKNKYKADRADKSVFVRNPSFYDEEAFNYAMSRIDSAVSSQKKFKPLMYTTDECGVTDLVTAWDFCFDDRTLSEMRKWLIEIYGDLDAINKQWDTDFKSIDEVIPFTTDEIFAREGNNLSPWADHRHFMNKCFADAVKKATEQVHKNDSEAIWGLVGCQMPAAFGGYDYWLLEKTVDMFEPYNIGNNREIIRSLNPVKPCITTSFGHSDDEVWRLWHQALHGDRGIIIYDEQNCYLNSDGTPTKLGLSCKPVYNELISGVIKQYTYTSERPAKAAIHYSHASITAFWELEISKMKADWVNRGSGTDRFDSDFFRLRESAVKVFEDNQAPYKFTAYAELENGEFENDGINILFMPQSIAISKKEIQAVKRYVNRGGIVIADCSCALMDEHCKELDDGAMNEFFGISGTCIEKTLSDKKLAPVDSIPAEFEWAKSLTCISELSSAVTGISVTDGAIPLFINENGTPAVIVKNHGLGKSVYLNLDITDYHRWRLKANEGDNIRKIFKVLFEIAEAVPYTPFTAAVDEKNSSKLEIFNRHSGNMELIAVHRNYQLRISELGPPEYQDISMLQNEFDVEIDLGRKRAVYDVRNGKFLGMTDKVSLNMPIWEPVVITAFDAEIKLINLNVPETAAAGEIVPVSIAADTESPADTHVFRCTVTNSDGIEIRYYTQNITAPNGKAKWSFPLAKDIKSGCYIIKVKDIATGITAIRNITIK